MKVPPLKSQLSASEVFRIIMSAVPAPNVTPTTVILLFATKSLVAAKDSVGNNKDKIIAIIFFII